jgi:microcystin-dependent protein
MSASNYIISTGESLDDIFEKRNSQQQSAQATNYYNTDGQDLNVIFLKKSSSSTAATTTNYNVNGNDLNTFFEALNTSTVGSILIWPTTTAPTNYLLCDGTSYSTSTYSSLFSAIGTTYGSTSSTTFNVPDFTNNSKTFMSSTYSVVEGGNNNLDLSQSDYGIGWATHNHTIKTSTIDFTHTHTLEVGSGTQYTGAIGTNYILKINNDGDGNFQFLSGQQLESGGQDYQTMTLDSEAVYTNASISGQSDNTPSSRDSTIEILNPYITINYIIKYKD